MTTKAPTAELLDRVPPHNLDAERALLGGLIVGGNPVMDDVADVVRGPDFYQGSHGELFEIIRMIDRSGRAIDPPMVVDWLKQAGKMEATGGKAYLAKLIGNAGAPLNVIHYARDVRKTAGQRRLIHALADGLRAAHSGDDAADTILDRVERDVADERTTTEAVDAADAALEAVARARELRMGERDGGLPTGLFAFDQEIGGLFPGELTVLAARPGVGKTALAIQVSAYSADHGRRVLFISLEMGRVELLSRLLAGRADMDGNRLRNGLVTEAELETLQVAAGAFPKAVLLIDDQPRQTVADVRRSARRMKRQGGLSLIVVDYLTRITPANPRARRWEAVGQLVGDLKAIARELDTPVLCLAQLNRQAEAGNNQQPLLSHLRESGNIEQDSDAVLFLHRPDAGQPSEPDGNGKAMLFVGKNRNGPTGQFELAWDGRTTSFTGAIDTWAEFDQ